MFTKLEASSDKIGPMKNIATSAKDKSSAANIVAGLEAQANERGMSLPAFLAAEHPELADIMRRMLKAEIAARKENVDPKGCERCELLNIAR